MPKARQALKRARPEPSPLVSRRATYLPETLVHFEAVTENYEAWERISRRFVQDSVAFLKSAIPPGSSVLILGCPAWQLLEALKPSRGVGLHASRSLIQEFQERCSEPNLEFRADLPEHYEPDEPFDYVVSLNQTDLCDDPLFLLETARRFLRPDSKLIVSRINPLWQPLVSFASRLGLRAKDYRRNLLSDEMAATALEAKGYRLQGEYYRVLAPRRLPLLTPFLNRFIARLPLLHRLCFLKYSFATLQSEPEKPLTCSVIVPCLNEEGNIEECALRVPQMGAHTEVLIVDDGSTDGTAALARRLEARYPHIRLIQSPRNEGKGKAVMRGFAAAKGDLIFILDADMTVAPEELPDFYDCIRYGAAEFVSGTRFVFPMESEAMKLSNYLGNVFFSKLVQVIVGTPCTDTLCGTKVMRKKDFLGLRLEDSSWGDFDFIFHAANLKLRSRQIPVHYKNRVAGKSKMKALSAGARFLAYCLKAWRRIS